MYNIWTIIKIVNNTVKTVKLNSSFLISHTLASKQFFLFTPLFFSINISTLYWSRGIKYCARHGLIKKPINRRARRVQLTDDNLLLIVEYYRGNCLWSVSTRRSPVFSEQEEKRKRGATAEERNSRKNNRADTSRRWQSAYLASDWFVAYTCSFHSSCCRNASRRLNKGLLTRFWRVVTKSASFGTREQNRTQE